MNLSRLEYGLPMTMRFLGLPSEFVPHVLKIGKSLAVVLGGVRW